MADVRALLAAERQSRRIQHPHLTYSKSGALNCNVCNLNIKSEQLWPGHLKSLNHRKNIQKLPEQSARPTKRKIESVEGNEAEGRNYDVDSRKKPKPIPDSVPGPEPGPVQPVPDDVMVPEPVLEQEASLAVVHKIGPLPSQPAPPIQQIPPEQKRIEDVDEDEWAAFEREVAPLAQADYSSATIEAAPVSAAEAMAQPKINAVQEREDEAEAEKEDESRRMEEEFEVMEEMEDRVKRLRARREALRARDSTTDPDPNTANETKAHEDTATIPDKQDEEQSSDDEVNDWYG